MKKRTAFIGVILFLYTFPFLNDEVFARSNVNNILVAELRPIPGIKYGSYRLFNRAGKKYNEGNYKEAIKLFSKYIIKYSSSGEYDYVDVAYFNRALSKSKIGDHNGAISDYTKAIEMNYEKLSDAYLNRSISKEKIGDFKGACLDAKKLFHWVIKVRKIMTGLKITVKGFKSIIKNVFTTMSSSNYREKYKEWS